MSREFTEVQTKIIADESHVSREIIKVLSECNVDYYPESSELEVQSKLTVDGSHVLTEITEVQSQHDVDASDVSRENTVVQTIIVGVESHISQKNRRSSC